MSIINKMLGVYVEGSTPQTALTLSVVIWASDNNAVKVSCDATVCTIHNGHLKMTEVKP